MGQPKEKPLITVAQYLALERAARERHEYLDGEIFAMAGESVPHGHTSVNLIRIISTHLRGTPCSSFVKDMKVRSGPERSQGTKGMFSYPDIVVVCGEIEYHDDRMDVILNPIAIVEVLSPSTEFFDRYEKFQRLIEWNPALVEYLLVAQEKPVIDQFHRNDNNDWIYQGHRGLKASVTLPSISCTLKLAEVYERVKFEDDASAKPARRTRKK